MAHPVTDGLSPEEARFVIAVAEATSAQVGRHFEVAGLSVAQAEPLMARALAFACVMNLRATSRVLGREIDPHIEALVDLIRATAQTQAQLAAVAEAGGLH